MQKLKRIYRYRDAVLALNQQPASPKVHWKKMQKSLPKLGFGLETLQIAQYLHIKHKESQFPMLWKELCEKSIKEGQVRLALYFQPLIRDDHLKLELLQMIENLLRRKDQSIRNVFLRRWLKLLVSMELDSPDDYIKKAVFMIIESDQEFLMDCLLEHPTYSSRIPYVTVLRKLMAKKHSKVFEIYQHSKKHCVLPADLLHAILKHFSQEIDSDLNISKYPLEREKSLLKALNACYRIGDIDMAFQFLSNTPESLEDQQIFDLVLKICMVHDEASNLQRLASLICDDFFDIGLESVSKLSDHLVRLRQFNSALELIRRYKSMEIATKLFDTTISSNLDIAVEIIKSGYNIEMGYGYFLLLYNHVMKNRLSGYQDTPLLSPSKHLDALDMALSEKNLDAVVTVVQASFAIGFSIPDKYFESIRNTFALQYHPVLLKLFLLTKKDIPENWIAGLKDDFAKSRLRRVAACLKLLKKQHVDYYPFLPSLTPRLSSVLLNHEVVFERFRFLNRLRRMDLLLPIDYRTLTTKASRVVSYAILDHSSEALAIIQTSRFVGIPLHYPTICQGFSRFSPDIMFSLWQNHPTLLDYPRFFNEVLFHSLVLQKEGYCRKILNVYKTKGLLTLEWCKDYLMKRRFDYQRKLFFRTVDGLGLFRYDPEWVRVGLVVFHSFREDRSRVRILRKRKKVIAKREQEQEREERKARREQRKIAAESEIKFTKVEDAANPEQNAQVR